MPTITTQQPTYRKQKRRGKPALAFVELNGKKKYLGEHDTPESHRRYAALIAEWRSGSPVTSPGDDLRIAELVDQYWTHAQGHYRRPDGTPTSELDLVRRALAVLSELYADLPVAEFGPLRFKAVRLRMIEKDWCRKVVNDMAHRVKAAFRWAVENELAPSAVIHGLSAVKGLKAGRTEARESEPVRPVPEHAIGPVLDQVAPQVADMIRLQLLTGARPGEICQMRACDIDMAGEGAWTYRPTAHKTQHHGHKRTVYLGPQARIIVRKYLRPDLQGYLFSPAEAEAWHRQRRREQRKTPEGQGNGPGTNRKSEPQRRPGDHYTVATYRRAISRACDIAFPPPDRLCPAVLPSGRRETREEFRQRLTEAEAAELRRWVIEHRWHPHRLRHNAATRIRKESGIEIAQTILGHRLGSGITEIYAEANVERAKAVIGAIG